MQIRNSSVNYGIIAKILHWLIAILVLVMLLGGYFMDKIAKPWHAEVVNLHKLIGISILALMIIRLAWRFINCHPKLPASISRTQVFLAQAIHYLLYLLVVIMPLAGWVMSISANKPPHIAGLALTLPDIPQSQALGDFCWQVHSVVAWLLIILISLHILAALKHALINKDGVLARMWFS